MFRASPWISFQPPPPLLEQTAMDEDIDMDAPQISTLREEETPPPRAATQKKLRVKLLVKNKPPATSSATTPRDTGVEDGENDDEEEEDQLIDDDDEFSSKPAASRAAAETPTKRKAATKRKPRKTEKRPLEEDKKIRLKVPLPGTGSASAMTSGDATPEAHIEEDSVRLESSEAQPIPIPVTASDSISSGRPAKKPRKEPAKPRAKKGPKKRVQDLHVPLDDSEGHTGTAASSPLIAPMDMTSEPDIEPDLDVEALPPPPLMDDTNLDNIPLPVYPLPAKPFPVQPPPKFGSGFAPMIPLDRSGKKVRHWRVANREIRGIAGGRWFARSWVGEKQSQYSAAHQAKLADMERIPGLTLPKLVAASISTPPLGRAPGKLKAARQSALSQSAGSSRAGSVIAEATARPPTKMRTIVSAASVSDNEIMEAVDAAANRDVEMARTLAE